MRQVVTARDVAFCACGWLLAVIICGTFIWPQTGNQQSLTRSAAKRSGPQTAKKQIETVARVETGSSRVELPPHFSTIENVSGRADKIPRLPIVVEPHGPIWLRDSTAKIFGVNLGTERGGLALSCAGVNDLHLIRNLDNVDLLVLEGPHIDDECSEVVVNMKSIRKLILQKTCMTAVGFHAISKMEQLQHFEICDPISSPVTSVANQKNERRADLGMALRSLAQMPNLKVLDLEALDVSDVEITEIGVSRSLVEIRLARMPLTDRTIAVLSQMESLRRISFRALPITRAGVLVLAQCNQLEQVRIYFCDGIYPSIGEKFDLRLGANCSVYVQ